MAKAAQAGFSALVTEDNPAPAGSTIHNWLTGLGPLDRPSPYSHRLLHQRQRKQPAPPAASKSPFLAYAPGLLGVYQADLVIPARWPAGPATLECRDRSVGSTTTTYVAAN